MRYLAVALVALAFAATAAAKEGMSVVVIGPKGPPFVEPPQVFRTVLGLQLRLVAPPQEPYVLVYPLMRSGVPARPGRWFPRSGTLCSGWRSGVEAGCATAPKLGGWLGSGIATGLFTREPVRLTALTREGSSLLPFGNEATAVKLALHQRGKRAAAPAGCVAFTARWSASGWPGSFCVAPAGGLYASGRVYPLAPDTAAFVSG
jgi:hypothetical protein